ncbi:kinase-like domain-containing protein [Radiomyces spectabilis]|uniref:kinase-like domain-containing protein n=1 Tax=Radiomyces spectabilis TaxID=64574 RepID=UPI00222101D1|nr:kinase-like domain-containing protein [Radiomyces spectabilis]KAI8376526.1 kinase-like domain-containing protein [Radiomyces spectabilis]
MSVKTDSTSTRPGLSSLGKYSSATNMHSNSSPGLLTHHLHSGMVSAGPPAEQLDVNRNPLDASESNVPSCYTVIDLNDLKGDELRQAVFQLIETLFPGMASPDQGTITLERMCGAMTNSSVFLVTVNDNQRMLMRIYGNGCDQIIDRNKELHWISRLSQLDLGPRLLAIFGNGRFEEYLPSTTLSRTDIRNPTLSRQVASRLCHLHTIVQVYPPSPEEAQQLEVWKNVDKWYRLVLSLLPELTSKEAQATKLQEFDIVRLRKEIELCKIILGRLRSPIVFAHNDTQYGNILKLEGSGDLVVIDFEYAGYNARGYDIANHFCEWMYDYHCEKPALLQLDQFPTIDEQLTFLKAYVDANENDHTDMEVLHTEVSMWVMASHLSWGLWGLIQACHSDIEFDYFLYSMQRLGAFRSELTKWTSA